MVQGDGAGQRLRLAHVTAVVVGGHVACSVGSTQKGDQHQQLQESKRATGA